MGKLTRDVISDLWPLYVSGEASSDTRALIEAFLQEDPEFARTLTTLDRERFPSLEAPSLPPDHELKTLALIKRRLAGPRPLLLLALVFTALAFGRIISDTSFDVSPRRFIATAVVAACFWVAFLVRLFKGRREVLVRIRR
jgi:anti-sigma factor RsiW